MKITLPPMVIWYRHLSLVGKVVFPGPSFDYMENPYMDRK